MKKSIKLLAVDTPFNAKSIKGRTSQFSVAKKGDSIITYNGKTPVCSWKSSKIYEIVDFKLAVNMLLNVIGGIFTPLFYDLEMDGGVQELKLRGKELKINGEVFHEMLWLTNSTNGRKRLAVRYGLLRQVCSNGLCVTAPGTQQLNLKLKHLTANEVNKELQKFMKNLPVYEIAKTVKVIEHIADKKIRVKELAHALINDYGKKGNENVWHALVTKLLTSETDKLGGVDDAFIKGIKMPLKNMPKAILNTELNAYQVFNCYTEIYRAYDANVMELESTKILEIVSK